MGGENGLGHGEKRFSHVRAPCGEDGDERRSDEEAKALAHIEI
jgi:hypothetical protein